MCNNCNGEYLNGIFMHTCMKTSPGILPVNSSMKGDGYQHREEYYGEFQEKINFDVDSFTDCIYAVSGCGGNYFRSGSFRCIG